MCENFVYVYMLCMSMLQSNCDVNSCQKMASDPLGLDL